MHILSMLLSAFGGGVVAHYALTDVRINRVEKGLQKALSNSLEYWQKEHVHIRLAQNQLVNRVMDLEKSVKEKV